MRVSEPPSLAPEVLSARIRKIREAYSNCTLCSQRCGADRSRDPSGVCRLGEEAFVYREYLHFGEEPWISPSYTVYLSGCNLRCLFCSEWNPVTRPARHGVRLEPGGLAQRIAHSFDNGAKSLSFVGGEPGVNLLPVLETLALLPRDWPVVWNTNGMGILESFGFLEGLVHTWLVDWKFGNTKCAGEVSGFQSAADEVFRASAFLQGKGETLSLRHLVMPGHLECCTLPVMERWSDQFGSTPFNLMTSFLPPAAERGAWRVQSGQSSRLEDCLKRFASPFLFLNGHPL